MAEAAMAAVVEARAEAHSSTIGSSSTPAATVLPNAFEADALEPAPGEAALCTMADAARLQQRAQLGSARLKRSE